MNMKGEEIDPEDKEEAREMAAEAEKMKEAKEDAIEAQAEKEYEACFGAKRSACLLEKEFGLNFDVSRVIVSQLMCFESRSVKSTRKHSA